MPRPQHCTYPGPCVCEPFDPGKCRWINESALTTIVRALSQTYTDEGVLIWLNAKNKQLPSKPDGNWTCSPAEYIAAGHAAEVLDAARRIEGGSPIPTGPDEQWALEADAMLEPSPSAMLAGIHITRRQVQDCACRGRHEHRYGYTADCAVRDCTCDGTTTGPAAPEPTEETPGLPHPETRDA